MTTHTYRKFVLSLALGLTVSALGNQRDIFTNEAQTRRPAQADEFEIALGLGGCAGALIAPNVGMSAAHCRKSGGIKSGVALRDGLSNDITIGKTLEIGSVSKYDYWIFEVKWNSGSMTPGMRLVPFVQIAENDLRVGANDVADEIYTLGFPQDIAKGRLMYSSGYGKKYDSTSLVNNVSLINGNSGGGIWRLKDNMLVSVVSGGPHAFGQSGWKGNDWNDAAHWNWGPAMWKVYAQSAVLKDLFPNGKNKFLDGEWELAVFDLSSALGELF